VSAGEYLTADEAGEVIGMSADYVARQCRLGNLRGKKLGKQWRISRASLDAFMGDAKPAPPTRDRRSARQMRRSA
jgi:excisionase family DNA binding protein